MGRELRKLKKRLSKILSCPSCQTSLPTDAAKNKLVVCLYCGEWVVMRGNVCQRVALFEDDLELQTDEGEAVEWSLTSRIS